MRMPAYPFPFAPTPTAASAATPVQVAGAPRVRCVVRVVTPDEVHVYDGLFPTCLDARMDAVDRFWDSPKPIRIGVRAVKGGAV